MSNRIHTHVLTGKITIPVCIFSPVYIALLSVIFLLLGGINTKVFGQYQVEIVNADSITSSTTNGQTIQKLIGNVHLVLDDMTVQSDSAFRLLEQNRVHAFNLEIDTGTEMIWADTLYHLADQDLSEFRGRVILESETNTLFSNAIDFDHALEVALFQAPVHFIDETGRLNAREGYYIQSSDIAFFEGDVQLMDDVRYLEADSLYMNRQNDFYQLFNRVYAVNYEEDVTFAGNYLETDSTGYSLLRENAWMMQESETDTSHISAWIIEVQESDSVSFIDAFGLADSIGGVEIFSRSFTAITDTMHYRDDIEEFRLISNPIAWNERTQLTGPYIRALIEDDNINFMDSYTRPVVVQEDSATGRLNQMTGDTLNVFFDNGDIQQISLFPNSALIFHNKDDSGEPSGLIEASAVGPSTITFIGGEPEQLKMEPDLNGVYISEDSLDLDNERRLPEFRWDPELRPEEPEIRQPRHSEMPQELPFNLPPRYEAHLEERE